MSTKLLMNEIITDVQDIIGRDFSFYPTRAVPSSEDSNLTFENGAEKRGKSFDTCILYTDIRDSVSLTKTHQNKTMGKLYTAFIKGVIKAAHHHSGFVRNIIGDRVMIVFPPKDCFNNAVNCAISINHIASKIINKEFKGVNFKCGIGIDFGRMRVVKVGVPKYGKERVDNKNLVWVGRPANFASRLTDIANKEIQEEYYEVKYYPVDLAKTFVENYMPTHPSNRSLLNHVLGDQNIRQKKIIYSDSVKVKKYNSSEFLSKIATNEVGKVLFSMGKLISFEKKIKNFHYKPILVSDKVYNGFKRALPNSKINLNHWCKEQEFDRNDYRGVVWGLDLHWKLS